MGTIDEDIAGLDAADAAWISAVYDIARELAPEAEQGTSYGMPALMLRGRPLISARRTSRHYGVYPFSAAAVEAARTLLDGVEHAKGTVRFPFGSDVPTAVIRALVGARRAELEP